MKRLYQSPARSKALDAKTFGSGRIRQIAVSAQECKSGFCPDSQRTRELQRIVRTKAVPGDELPCMRDDGSAYFHDVASSEILEERLDVGFGDPSPEIPRVRAADERGGHLDFGYA